MTDVWNSIEQRQRTMTHPLTSGVHHSKICRQQTFKHTVQ